MARPEYFILDKRDIVSTGFYLRFSSASKYRKERVFFFVCLFVCCCFFFFFVFLFSFVVVLCMCRDETFNIHRCHNYYMQIIYFFLIDMLRRNNCFGYISMSKDPS